MEQDGKDLLEGQITLNGMAEIGHHLVFPIAASRDSSFPESDFRGITEKPSVSG
jgi:hypothetical protein